MSRIFILGAGASKFAEYPLGLDLWRFIRDYGESHVMANERRIAVIEAVEKILEIIPPEEFDRPNLEELFTYLDLASTGSQLLQLVKIDWAALRSKLMGMITDAFQWHQYKLLANILSPPNFLPTLEKWTNLLAQGDTIITFNWDLLHEAALWKVEKWHYADGYGFTSSDAPEGKSSPIKILKLHGSVNWVQQDEQDCEPSIEHKADFFLGALDDHEKTHMKSAGKWNEGRNLIVPSYLKDISFNRLLLTLWNQAYDALVGATEITVIGFQLHPADAPARQLFGSSLLRNKQLKNIFVVSPGNGPDNWDSFCFHLGKVRKRIRQTFEDWVMSL